MFRQIFGILDPAYPLAASAYPKADPTLFPNQFSNAYIMVNQVEFGELRIVLDFGPLPCVETWPMDVEAIEARQTKDRETH